MGEVVPDPGEPGEPGELAKDAEVMGSSVKGSRVKVTGDDEPGEELGDAGLSSSAYKGQMSF